MVGFHGWRMRLVGSAVTGWVEEDEDEGSSEAIVIFGRVRSLLGVFVAPCR